MYKLSCLLFLICAGKIQLMQSGDCDVSKSLEELSKCDCYIFASLHSNFVDLFYCAVTIRLVNISMN